MRVFSNFVEGFIIQLACIAPGIEEIFTIYLHGPGGRVFCAAKTRWELPFSLRLADSPARRAGRGGLVLEEGQKPAPGKKVRVPVLASRSSSAWVQDRIFSSANLEMNQK